MRIGTRDEKSILKQLLIFSYLLDYTVFVSFSIWYNKFEKNALLVVIIFEINGVWCICCNFNIYTIVLLSILSDRYIIEWYVVYWCTNHEWM